MCSMIIENNQLKWQFTNCGTHNRNKCLAQKTVLKNKHKFVSPRFSNSINKVKWVKPALAVYLKQSSTRVSQITPVFSVTLSSGGLTRLDKQHRFKQITLGSLKQSFKKNQTQSEESFTE